jgi:hypothetical protein
MRSVLHYNGMPLTAGYVVDAVMSLVQEQAPLGVVRNADAGRSAQGAKP